MFPHEPPTPERGARGPLLHLDPATRSSAVFRLKNVQGHLGAISRMVADEHTYCADVPQRIRTVQGALGKINAMVLRSHVKDRTSRTMPPLPFLEGTLRTPATKLIEALKDRG